MTLASLALSCLLASPAANRGGATEWNQPRGSADGSAVVDVEPIRTDPEEAWRLSLKHLDADPVCASGMVYVVATQGTSRKLYALDARTGEYTATPAILGTGDRVFLAASQGFVAVVEHDAITLFQHHGRQLATSKDRRFPGRWTNPPCVDGTYLFVSDANRSLNAFDLRQGKKIGSGSGGVGRPAAIPVGTAGDIVVASTYYAGDVLTIARCALRGADKGKPVLVTMPDLVAGKLKDVDGSEPPDADAYVAWMPTAEPDAEGTWFAYSPRPLMAEKGPPLHTLILPRALSPIAVEAAVFGDFVCGFSERGSLVRFRSDGKHGFVVPEDKPLPAGARRGRATIAKDVIYLENWAVEIQSGRVLWCKPDLEPSTALIPLADGQALYATKNGDLVCLRDPGTATAKKPSAAGASRVSIPGSGDGVVTAEGQRIEGKVTDLADGRVRVERKGGAPVELASAELALVEEGDAARLVGEAYPIYLAFSSALAAETLDAFARAFEGYLRAGFLEDCRRLLVEARDYDPEGRVTSAMEKHLSGLAVSKSANAAAQLERLKKEEVAMRGTRADAFSRAAAWSRGHGAALVASALLLDSDRVLPGRAEIDQAAAALVPAGFPPAADGGGPNAWLRLAKEVLPVSGEVVGLDDAAWKTLRAAPWAQKALAMRTRNLNLLSTERDPDVVGSCLRHGEKAMRIVARVLGDASTGEARARGARPFQVILHKDRAEFLAASKDAGHPHQEWSAGFYSPLENLSRFYVMRVGAAASPLERALDHVLAHELCHQYISQRWLGGEEQGVHGDPKLPGFWIVEGVADFVAEQAVEMDRHGERFDDDTVLSIDASARLLEAGKLMPVAELLDLSQMGFLALATTPMVTVQTRHRLGVFPVTAKDGFYAESASLVFYLVNRATPGRRDAVIAYLRSWYASGVEKGSSSRLGFERVEDLEAGYLAFLREAGH